MILLRFIISYLLSIYTHLLYVVITFSILSQRNINKDILKLNAELKHHWVAVVDPFKRLH